MTGSFAKYSASGNDFVLVDGREEPEAETWSPDRIRRLCARRTGVGADGLIVLGPGTAPDRVRFAYFNGGDGLRCALCGNGALSAAVHARRIGLVEEPVMVLETDAGPVEARVLGPDRAAVVLPDAGELQTKPEIALAAFEQSAHRVVVGVPHLVVLLDGAESLSVLDVDGRGRVLRNHESLGPEGANVNFVARGGGWSIRTFERGVEAETLACGTGAAAAAAVLGHLELSPFPCHLTTVGGFDLEVDGRRTGVVAAPMADVVLTGAARRIYRGELD